MSFSGQVTLGSNGAGLHHSGLHTKSLAGTSAHKLQLSGVGFMQTNPGLQPHVRSEFRSYGCRRAGVMMSVGAQVVIVFEMVVAIVIVEGGLVIVCVMV